MNILIASPDFKLLSSLKELLSAQNISHCGVGKDTQLELSKNEYDFIIIDSNIRNHTFPFLIKFCKVTCPSVNIILTFESEEILKELDLSPKDIGNMGIFSHTIGPNLPNKLVNIIKKNLNNLETSPEENHQEFDYDEYSLHDRHFTKIKTSAYISKNKSIFDVYIRINTNKYIKILNKGESISIERINNYINKHSVEYLYFKTEDRQRYITYMNNLASKIKPSTFKLEIHKGEILGSTTEKYLEEIYTKGLDRSQLKLGVSISDNTYELLKNSKSTAKLLEELPKETKCHNFLTSLFSISICNNINWAGRTTLNNIAMGCLLHDIGLVRYSWFRNNPNFNLDSLTKTQVEEYRLHPENGYDMLRDIGFIPESVRQIVLQHHERVNTSGFPFGLNSQKIYPLAQIVSLADFFSHIIIDNNESPLEALRNFIPNKELTSQFHADYIKALIKGFIK